MTTPRCSCGRSLSDAKFAGYCNEDSLAVRPKDATHEWRNCECGTSRMVECNPFERRARTKKVNRIRAKLAEGFARMPPEKRAALLADMGEEASAATWAELVDVDRGDSPIEEMRGSVSTMRAVTGVQSEKRASVPPGAP